MFSNVLAVLVDLHSIVGSLFVAVLQVGVFSFSIARMRSVGLRKINKGFVFVNVSLLSRQGSLLKSIYHVRCLAGQSLAVYL